MESCCKNFDPNGPRFVYGCKYRATAAGPTLAGQVVVKSCCTKCCDTGSQIDGRIDLCGLLILPRALRTTAHFIAGFCHPASMSVAVILSCQLMLTCRFLSPCCHCVSLSLSVLCCSHSLSVSPPMPAGYAGAFQRGAKFPPHVGSPAVQ